MARKKIRKIKIENDIQSMLKKPEVWVGLVTVILIAVVGGNSVKGKIKKILNQRRSIIISPVPLAVKVTPKLSLTVTPTVIMVKETTPTPVKKEEAKKTITKFADTDGYYQVKEGDSYALISQKVCGSQRWFEQIAYENGYQPLYANDLIAVNCGE